MTIFTIANYEIRKLMRVKAVIINLFILPLLLIFILGSALSDLFIVKDQEIEKLQLVIYHADQGVLQEPIEEFLHSSGVIKYIQSDHLQSREEVEDYIKSAKADYGLVIPSDFSEKVMKGDEASWELIRGNDRMKNLTAESIINSFLEQTNLMQASAMVLNIDPFQAAMGQDRSGQSSVLIGKLSRSDKEFTATQYYAAAMLVMFLLYSGMSAAISLVTEKEEHTLFRLNSLPIQPYKVLLGKLFGNGILAVIQAMAIILGTAFIYGVDWGENIAFLALICLSLIVASMSIAIIATILFKTTKVITIVFQTVIIIMTFLSGGFSPEVGSFIQKIARFTISHWASDGILQMMLYNGSSAIHNHQMILGMLAAGLLTIAITMYRKVGYQ